MAIRSVVMFVVFAFSMAVQGQGYGPAYDAAHPNGDAYFLIGDLESHWGNREFGLYADVARWLSRNGFRPIVNPYATLDDLREAVANPATALIIWSGHAYSDGRICDVEKCTIPNDVFTPPVDSRLSLVVMSACHGQCISTRYLLPENVRMMYWEGKTDTPALFNYLQSDRFRTELMQQLQLVQSLK